MGMATVPNDAKKREMLELRKAMDSMEARVDINSEEAVDIRFYLGDEAREHPAPNDRNHSSTVSSL